MADSKLTDQQVTDLLKMLHGDASLDSKVHRVTAVKSGIKQHNVPESSVTQLFDALRTAATSQHAVLVNAGFTALNHLLTRLSRQEPRLLAKEAPRTLSTVVDKLGDQKEKFRALASQALGTLHAVAPADVERAIRNQAMVSKNPRAKESAMQWLLHMHREQGLQFRSYVPLLMELLEDADGMVRDAAKGAVIELFKTAPNAAKADLKRQLKNFKVRHAIEQAIVKALAPATGTRPDTPSDAVPSSRLNLAASISSVTSERPATPLTDSHADPIEPLYVNTNRELEDTFRDMALHFDGKETEQNWMKREQSIGTLRKLNAGNAAVDFHDPFLAGLRTMLDGIIKAINSLRTSLSKEGCGLVQDIAVTFGPAIDPLVELLMQTLIKLSAGTKKISSQLANVTVHTIVGRVSYSVRLMQHIWGACQDKNVQPRLYATGWLKTLVRKEAHHKSYVEHTGGVDLMDKCIKKGLGDANPGVREKMRSTYWTFWAVWPARADVIMAGLDATAQKLLNKDPNNPNSPNKVDEPPRPGLGLSRSTIASSKPSLREAMMAQKKASMGSRNLPARPGSAMAHISPVRSTSNSSSYSTASVKSSSLRARPEPTVSVNAGGMSVAPMRPTRRRPDMAPRPATAGPYSMRDQLYNAEVGSPESVNSRGGTPKHRATPPRKTTQHPRPQLPPNKNDSSPVSPTARAPSKLPSLRGSPASSRFLQKVTLSPSPSKPEEEMTLVVPEVPSIPSTLMLDQLPKVTIGEEMRSSGSAAALEEVVSDEAVPAPAPESPLRVLEVYVDPFPGDHLAVQNPAITAPVLEDRPVNEDAGQLRPANGLEAATEPMSSREKARQNSRLLDSGINKIKAKALEVHDFRKMQSLIRDGKAGLTDDKFDPLLTGLFQYLEDPLTCVPSEKAQDIRTQILATIKLLLKREREKFQPFVSKGLESLLITRSGYDSRAHVVSGLELLADELVSLGDGSEIIIVLTERLQGSADTSSEGCRILSMGLYVLRELLEKRPGLVPADKELKQLTALAGRTLGSANSGVRMDAVKLCVSLHQRVGDDDFWAALRGIDEDPKNLITYYIVKQQREQAVSS